MLLLTEEKEDTIYNYYSSANILYSEYNKSTLELLIVFKNKHQYKYYNVPNNVHLHFMLSDSNGKFFIKNIVKKYDNEKLDELKNLDEINNIFNQEDEN